MTFNVEIVSVETTGDGLCVKGQGKSVSAPEWAQYERFSFVVPMRCSKTYYIGRMVKLKVAP